MLFCIFHARLLQVEDQVTEDGAYQDQDQEEDRHATVHLEVTVRLNAADDGPLALGNIFFFKLLFGHVVKNRFESDGLLFFRLL